MNKYAPEKVFVLENNRYIEISYEELCERIKRNKEYKNKLFLPLHGMLMEARPEDYRKFYQAERRWKYLMEQSAANSDTSYDMLTTEELCGENTIEDHSLSVEDIVEMKVMVEKLQNCLHELSPEEWQLIEAIYYQGLTEKEIALKEGISQVAVHKRKHKILDKLKKILEN